MEVSLGRCVASGSTALPGSFSMLWAPCWNLFNSLHLQYRPISTLLNSVIQSWRFFSRVQRLFRWFLIHFHELKRLFCQRKISLPVVMRSTTPPTYLRKPMGNNLLPQMMLIVLHCHLGNNSLRLSHLPSSFGIIMRAPELTVIKHFTHPKQISISHSISRLLCIACTCFITWVENHHKECLLRLQNVVLLRFLRTIWYSCHKCMVFLSFFL